MPKKKGDWKCHDCGKDCKNKRGLIRHKSFHKRSGLPNCPVAKQSAIRKIQEQETRKLSEQVNNTLLQYGHNDKKKQILMDEWVRYLWCRFGTTLSDHLELDNLKEKAKKKILKEPNGHNYFRWYKDKYHTAIDISQTCEDYRWPPNEMICGTKKIEAELENKDYLGRYALRDRVSSIVFDKVFKKWDIKFQGLSTFLGSKFLLKLKNILMFRESGWGIVRNNQSRECLDCCAIDKRPDWVFQFSMRHGKIYNTLTHDQKEWLEERCVHCRNELGLNLVITDKMTNHLWEQEREINNLFLPSEDLRFYS